MSADGADAACDLLWSDRAVVRSGSGLWGGRVVGPARRLLERRTGLVQHSVDVGLREGLVDDPVGLRERIVDDRVGLRERLVDDPVGLRERYSSTIASVWASALSTIVCARPSISSSLISGQCSRHRRATGYRTISGFFPGMT